MTTSRCAWLAVGLALLACSAAWLPDAAEAGDGWFIVWRGIYAQSGDSAGTEWPAEVRGLVPLVDQRCLDEVPVGQSRYEGDQWERPATPAVMLAPPPPSALARRDYVVAFRPGQCPDPPHRLVGRYGADRGGDLPAEVRAGLLAAGRPFFDGESVLWVASGWSLGPENVTAWAFVVGDFEGSHRWALVGIESSGGAFRVLHAEPTSDWAVVPAWPDLIALVDLDGDEEPELVAIEPLESPIGWSQVLTARVYSRGGTGSWRVVREVPLLHMQFGG